MFFIGLIRDITFRKQTEDALKASDLKFRVVASNLPNMVYMTDTTKACVFLNKTWSDFTGRLAEQDLGFGWADVIHPDDIDNVKNEYFTHFDAYEPFSLAQAFSRSTTHISFPLALEKANFFLNEPKQGA